LQQPRRALGTTNQLIQDCVEALPPWLRRALKQALAIAWFLLRTVQYLGSSTLIVVVVVYVCRHGPGPPIDWVSRLLR
jgi:hypothetical protein